MIYYSVFYAFIMYLVFFSESYRNRRVLYIAAAAAFVFSALRYDAGYDYFSYVHLILYETGASLERLEYLSKALMLISRKAEMPQLFFAVTSFIYVFFTVSALRKNDEFTSVSLMVLLFFIGCYLTSFDIVRQMVAVSIIFYAVTIFLSGRIYLSLVCFMLAFGFHKSALIYFPILFFFYFNQRERAAAVYIAIVLASAVLTGPAVSILKYFDLYYGYIEAGGSEGGYKIYLLVLFFWMSLLLFAKAIKVDDRLFWMSFNLFFFGIVLYTILLPYGYVITRLTYYLFPWAAVAWSRLFFHASRTRNSVFIFVFLISSFTYFAILHFSSLNPKNPMLNYGFYFLR